jgi:tRNA nucleotidyltransferase (CCA-adding enzyme)
MPTRIPPSILKAQDRALMQAVRKIAVAVNSGVGRRYVGRRPGRSDVRRNDVTTQRALLVGGFVRDLVLKRHPKDADLEVYGVDAKKLERLLKKLFPKRVSVTGKAFGVFKVALEKVKSKKTHSPLPTSYFPSLDVSIPRRESKSGRGHKGFTVKGDPKMKIKDAARRRDFTMNAMLLDPMTGEIVDPYHGMDDLKTHTLRIVDPKTFGDDPLRVYRAIQFAARFGLETDPKTTALLRKMVKDGATDELPKERITEEMRKLLILSERPSIGFELARLIGLIERDYPDLHALVNCIQNAGAHSEGSAWIHTMYVIDAMAKIIRDPKWKIAEDEKLPLMLTAVCHDLGKTRVPWQRIPGKELGYVSHAEAGGPPTKDVLKRFSFGDDINRNVVTLTVNHRRGGAVLGRIEGREVDEKTAANELRMLIRDIRPLSWNAYLALSTADTLGVTGWNGNERARTLVRTLDRVVKKFGLINEATKTLITGKDLIRLGVTQGPRIGRIIAEIEGDRDAGRISTRQEALALAKTLAGVKMDR